MAFPLLRAVVLLGAAVLAVSGCGAAQPATTFTDPKVVELFEAAEKGDRAEVDRLRGQGVAIDARGKFGMTPLLWSAAQGSDRGVVTLIAAGADRGLGSDNGATALHLAAERATTSMMQTLLDHGVAVSTPNTRDGSSALKNAIMNDRPANVTFLIEHGIDVTMADTFGNTALHTAAKINKADLVLQLMAAGADPTAVNKQGATFLTYLVMTPAKVRSAELQRGIDRVQEELTRRGIPIEPPR